MMGKLSATQHRCCPGYVFLLLQLMSDCKKKEELESESVRDLNGGVLVVFSFEVILTDQAFVHVYNLMI